MNWPLFVYVCVWLSMFVAGYYITGYLKQFCICRRSYLQIHRLALARAEYQVLQYRRHCGVCNDTLRDAKRTIDFLRQNNRLLVSELERIKA